MHKNKCGVLEVDCGDLAVNAVEASTQVHELDVAQVCTEKTIDSAAEESVCPQKWAESFGLHAVDSPLKLNASGGRIEHFGKSAVSFNPENCDGRTMEAKFEVERWKPLMAVERSLMRETWCSLVQGQKITSSCTLGPTTRCTCVGKATVSS